MDVSFKLDVAPSLLKLGSNTRKAIVSALAEMRDNVVNEIKRTQKFIDRSGNLRNSIIGNKVNDRELNVTVEAKMEYGKWLNDGTRRGLTPRRFMEEGLFKASGRFESIQKKHLDRRL